MKEIFNLISTYGFPMVLSIYLLVRFEPMIKEFRAGSRVSSGARELPTRSSMPFTIALRMQLISLSKQDL